MGNSTSGQPDNSLSALASLMQLFMGTQSKQSQTGGGNTQTSQTQMSDEAVSGMLKTLLENAGSGLTSTAQGQKIAGLYNSSTNKLLTNDLLSRITAQTALASAPKVTTTTNNPSLTLTKQGGMTKDQSMDLAKLGLAFKAYQELGGTKALKSVGGSVVDFISGAIPSGASPTGDFPGVDAAQATGAGGVTPTGLDYSAQEPGLQVGTGVNVSNLFDSLNFTVPSLNSTTDAAPVVQSTDAPIVTQTDSTPVEDTTNFQEAPAESSTGSNLGSTDSASKVLTGADSVANTTLNVSSTGGSIYSLGTGISQLTDSNSQNDIAGAANTASGAYGAYKGYEAYDNASKMAATANEINAAEGIQSSYTATDYMTTDFGSAGSGSVLGYVGPIMDAIYAPNNPKGAQNKDYRHAVGGAVLNYFGYGWASPIAHEIAQPALDASMDAGNTSMGNFGSVLADPVGAPLSGQYEIGDLVTSTLDPGNVFGGNKGGSVGSIAAAGVDPIGAALGDTGVFSVTKDAIDSIETNDPMGNAVGSLLGQGDSGGGLPGPGRVVCTELAMQGKISYDKYLQVLKPGITLTGRTLLGYHILGVPAVRRMRRDPNFVNKALPYVNAYLDHKLGKWNLTGFLIKNIGEPLCWLLSFFSRDPEYFKVLYPYRRLRNGS